MDLVKLLPFVISLIASGGKYAEIIKQAIALIQQIVAALQGSGQLPEPVNMTVQWAQGALKKLGFDPGPIDGDMGPKTMAAIKGFQTANSLEPDGWLGVETQTLLAQKAGAA